MKIDLENQDLKTPNSGRKEFIKVKVENAGFNDDRRSK